MKKITILMLHLLHGGIEKQTISLANQLCQYYEVEIVSTYSMLSKPAYTVDDRVKIKYLMDDKPNRQEIKEAIKSKKLIQIVKQGFKAVKILYLKKQLMINQVKKLDCDYVLSTRIEYADMLSKYAPKGVVTMTQEHLHDDSAKYVNRAKKAFKNLDYLLVLCDGSQENFAKWLKDNKKIKIVQIPNILESIPSESSSLTGNNLVSAGRLHPVKNFSTLIDIFDLVQKEIPDATLTIVGGGKEQDSLKEKIQSLGLESKITLTGMVSADQVNSHMLSSDIYLMTSHTECFPMVLLEASSVGLPLVSFDVPVGPRSIINDGENGYLIEYADNQAFADKVVHLLKNREELKKLGVNAKQNAYKYTKESIVPLWQNLFR